MQPRPALKENYIISFLSPLIRFRNVRLTFNCIIFLLATGFLYLRSRIARQLWSSMLGMCLKWMSLFGNLPTLTL